MSPPRRSTRAISTTMHSVPPLSSNFTSGGSTEPVTSLIQIKPDDAEPLVEEVKNLDMSDKPEDEPGIRRNRDPKFKRPKLTSTMRKKKRNALLARLITPKSALMLLHELKPGVKVKVFNSPNPSPMIPQHAEVVFEDQIIGKGAGNSKTAAKNTAAETALKNVMKDLVKNLQKKQGEAALEAPPVEEETMDYGGAESTDQELPPEETLPWAGLASYAIYRLFHQWQNEGFDFPLYHSDVLPTVPGIPGVPLTARPCANLPADAAFMHPVSLLHMMHPTAKMEELSRTTTPSSSVTVGYMIEGALYTGTAQNKKAARKIAAEAVRAALYPQLEQKLRRFPPMLN